jgi:hypothetical protein
MATCPRCKGHLTEHHRCPRSPARVALELAMAALAGGLVALLVVGLIDPHGQLALDGVVLIGGALAGAGLDWWLRS